MHPVCSTEIEKKSDFETIAIILIYIYSTQVPALKKTPKKHTQKK